MLLCSSLFLVALMGCRTTGSSSTTTVKDSHKGEQEFQAYLDRKRNGFVGKKAPSMALTTLDGKAVNPADLKGKIVLLNFWFAACKPCITEIPSLSELQKNYGDKNFMVVSISTDRRTVAEAVVQKYQMTYQIVADGKAFAERLKVVTFPTSFLIDQKGVIQEVFIGASADDATYTYSEVKPHLEALLP